MYNEYTHPHGTNMINERFNRLVVLELHSRDANNNARWLCRCDCGNVKPVLRHHLRSGHAQSCGCLRQELADAARAEAQQSQRPRTKATYKSMIRRCHDPRNDHFKSYGGKGVAVCDRWLYGDGQKTGWECFFEDMGPKPVGLTLERKDPYLGYAPDNCEWATWETQRGNRRKKT